MRYVLWKRGLYSVNLDSATELMIGDSERDELVVGKTKTQLQKKFGYLVTVDKANSYLRACYQSSTWKNEDVLFIRNSPWMVVFDGDRAARLVLIKGC
jgi:hypothetical protein